MGRIDRPCRNNLKRACPLPHGRYKKSYLFEKVINTYFEWKTLMAKPFVPVKS